MNYRFEHTTAKLLLLNLAQNSVDHIITDPPYGAEVQHKTRSAASLDDTDMAASANRLREFDFEPLDEQSIQPYAKEFARVAQRWVLVFCNVELVHAWRGSLEQAGLDYVRTGIWIKGNPAPSFSGDRPGVGYECYVLAHRKGPKRWNGGGRVAVHEYNTLIDRRRNGSGKAHPAEKPLALLEELVSLYTDPDEIILDPFAGVATHGVAALRCGRQFIGCEVQEKYYRIGLARLEAASQVQRLFEP